MPLLPFGETFHSSVSSKFLNFSVVMMSAAGRTRWRVPSRTPHPDGIVSIFHPRQPVVLSPSNKTRQPAARSSGLRMLSRSVPLPACKPEDGVVPRDRPDDLRPAGGADAESERLGAPRRCLQHEQGADPVQRHERRGQELLQLRPDRRPGLGRRSIVRAAVRRRDLGEPQVTDVARQRGLGDVEALALEELTQLLLARDGLRADDLQDRRVALRFHWAGMWPRTGRPATTVRRAEEDGGGRWRAGEGDTARAACFPAPSEPLSRWGPRARAPSAV